MAVVVAKLEQRIADLQALRALDEAAPIGAAAEFAVGHDLEPDLLLHMDGVADAIVLDARELAVADLLAGMLLGRLAAAARRPQQAADMIGAKRRTAVRTDAHAIVSRCRYCYL